MIKYYKLKCKDDPNYDTEAYMVNMVYYYMRDGEKVKCVTCTFMEKHANDEPHPCEMCRTAFAESSYDSEGWSRAILTFHPWCDVKYEKEISKEEFERKVFLKVLR